jgi:LPXTG-site transpeptidase (sortase) family protein
MQLRSGRNLRRRLVFALASATLLVVTLLLGYFALRPGSTPAPRLVVNQPATTLPLTEPAVSLAPLSTSPVARLTIPAIDVDARVISLGVDSDGVMQSPDNPTDVAWYTFAAHPGYPGNVVLAGHVDYVNYGPAVFWRLRDLKKGDDIYIALQDGSSFHYRVTSLTNYDDATAPVADIVGPTATPVVTLITCTGVFDSAAHNYNQRLVVRAEYE